MLLQSDTSFPGTVCQALRILSFTVTQLPGPNYHCHLGEATAVREWPEHWWEHVTLDLGRQVSPGDAFCRDARQGKRWRPDEQAARVWSLAPELAGSELLTAVSTSASHLQPLVELHKLRCGHDAGTGCVVRDAAPTVMLCCGVDVRHQPE